MIIVPSTGRAGVATTLTWLKPDAIVVRPSDYDAYRGAYPDANVVMLPHNDFHLGTTRQWILGQYRQPHLQIDDDVTHKSLDGGTWDDHVAEMFAMLDKYSMVGMGQSYLGPVHYKSGRVGENALCCTAMGFGDGLRDVDLTDFPIFEDLVLNIEAQKRKGTAVLYAAIIHNKRQKDGGCAGYRSDALMKECQERLQARYPDWVKLVPSDKKTQGTKLGRTVRISWKGVRTAKFDEV